MDHIPSCSDPHNPISVPYLGGSYGNAECFATFLSHKDIDLEALQAGPRADNLQLDHEAKNLQAWFFFGMLREVLQLEIVEADFIQVKDKRRWMTTRNLKGYLHRWKAEHESAKRYPMILEARKRRAQECIALSYGVWKGFDDGLFGQIVGLEVELSIQILAAALEHAVLSVSAKCQDCDWIGWVDKSYSLWKTNAQSDFLTQRMLADGWCPSLVERFCNPNHLSVQYLISLFGPPTTRDHRDCQANDNGCRALTVRNVGYRTLHVIEGCSCEFLGPELAELCRIIDEGGIPMLYLDNAADNGKRKLKVKKHRKGIEYTSISHVWAHGMGNPESNSLPRCQLERIADCLRPLPRTPIANEDEEQEDDKCWKMVRPPAQPAVTPEKLSSQPLYFWIDTICVPLKPDTIKTKAIEEMRKTYNKANRVLVIDADLMSTQLEPQLDVSDRREIVNARIMASDWQRRLWTLQEAVLAKKLWFQFAPGAFAKISLYPKDSDEVLNFFEAYYDNEVGYYCGGTDYEIEWQVNTLWDNAEVVKIGMVWQSLKARTTSYPTDVPLCIAILLDMDIRELLSTSIGDRTRKLWSMFPAIPAGILCHPCPKLENDNFRWAAASMDDCAVSCPPFGHPAYVSPDGMVKVNLDGFVMDLDRIAQAVIPIKVNGKIAYIRQNLKKGVLPWNNQYSTVFPRVPARIGLIIGEEPKASSTKAALEGCLAVMVSVVHDQSPHNESKSGESSSSLVVNYLRAVSIFGQGSWYDRHANPPWTKEELEEKQIEPLATTTLGVDQTWIIVPHGHSGDRVLE
ncbi:hypothetical protein MMC31_001866 [Peltigera leucophlebia]|nr:hypothetical protein [Peltigera leucophlebia]